MRTTIRLDERLLRQVKQFAAKRGRTLTAVIDDALRQFLAHNSEARRERAPVQLITFRGDGLRPGVDLDDSAALLEVMEQGNQLEKRR